MDAGIVEAGKSAIDVLLNLKGVDLVLTPAKGSKIEQPGGGFKYADGAALPSQRFSLSDRTGQSSAKTEGTTDTGVTVLTRQLVMTGRFDAQASIGSTWSDGTNLYRVDELIVDNEYKRQWLATQIGPDPHYG